MHQHSQRRVKRSLLFEPTVKPRAHIAMKSTQAADEGAFRAPAVTPRSCLSLAGALTAKAASFSPFFCRGPAPVLLRPSALAPAPCSSPSEALARSAPELPRREPPAGLETPFCTPWKPWVPVRALLLPGA